MIRGNPLIRKMNTNKSGELLEFAFSRNTIGDRRRPAELVGGGIEPRFGDCFPHIVPFSARFFISATCLSPTSNLSLITLFLCLFFTLCQHSLPIF